MIDKNVLGMKRIEKTIHVGDLLYRYFHEELSEEEKNVLDVWLQDPKNMEFFMNMKNSSMLYEGMMKMQNFDTKFYFQEVQEKIRKRKIYRIISYISGIAAVLFIGCMIILVSNVKESATIPSFPLTSPIAQKTFATLVKSSGQVVYLVDSVESLSSPERGVRMAKLQDKREQVIEEFKSRWDYNILETFSQGNIEIALCDGTRVWINEKSRLRYPDEFVNGQRVVYLEGEAYFEVEKDSLHPFIVKTKLAHIHVLGTSFNVNATDSSCVTTLVEGCVRMKKDDKDSVIIVPGEQASIMVGKEFNVAVVDTRYSIAWKENKFAFRDVGLKNILNEVMSWYGQTVYIRDSDLEKIRYTTIVTKYPSIERVLDILAAVGDFRYIKDDKGVIIIIR